MSETQTLFVGAVAPEDRRREPLHGTRLFAVLAPGWPEAEALIRARAGRGDAEIARREDAATLLYARRLPLRENEPREFSLDERG
ncbi:hypothetical protein [Aureimonas sp. ME7]|uniref:hypothetical protein n=1 Tax=Aureimonas sp. ME7 TaxID=2744252 RepID=UPI0015F4B532|nr:hypothetical protein [Aureimonas sp. ME7]